MKILKNRYYLFTTRDLGHLFYSIPIEQKANVEVMEVPAESHGEAIRTATKMLCEFDRGSTRGIAIGAVYKTGDDDNFPKEVGCEWVGFAYSIQT